jgi:SAM-dependent methyltransferase
MQTTTIPTATAGPIPLRRPAEKLCHGITRLFTHGALRRFSLRENGPGNRFESLDDYFEDRVSHVDEYRRLFSRFTSFRDKTVVELGCSSGYLLSSFREREPFTAIGADISPEVLAQARAKYGDTIHFIQTSPRSIPLPDACVDVVYTVDTVEHLSEPRAIFRDTYRILKPGGIFLVYFGPWYTPCGAHLEDIIPFPWPHAFFSMETLLNVAAHIYDSPDHKAACYWFDERTGERRPNPFLDREKWRVFLNKLTIRGFERVLRDVPFERVHFRCDGFGGRTFKAARALSWLARTPYLREYFTQYITCVLRKPAI